MLHTHTHTHGIHKPTHTSSLTKGAYWSTTHPQICPMMIFIIVNTKILTIIIHSHGLEMGHTTFRHSSWLHLQHTCGHFLKVGGAWTRNLNLHRPKWNYDRLILTEEIKTVSPAAILCTQFLLLQPQSLFIKLRLKYNLQIIRYNQRQNVKMIDFPSVYPRHHGASSNLLLLDYRKSMSCADVFCIKIQSTKN